MTKVLAIAGIAVRSAVHSRVVLALFCMLLLVVVGLPLTVKSDGTVAGHVQIVLGYTLGFASLILALATLWTGCAAVSLEVQNRQIHLIVTKPVHRAQIWVGKWLGLLFLNGVLLALCGLVVYGLLRWTTRPGQLSPEQQKTLREQVLVAQRQTLAPVDNVDELARTVYGDRRTKDQLPADLPADQAYDTVKQTLLTQAYAIPLGGKRRWVFHLPSRPNPNRPMFVQFQFSSSSPDKAQVLGAWLVGEPNSLNRAQIRQRSAPGGVHKIPIPPAAVGDDRSLTVEYGNINPVPVTVLFAPQDGVRVLTYEGSFEANLVRSLLVVFFQLALLGAVGISAGTLWSMPVAALVSGYVMILLAVGRYIERADPNSIFGMPTLGTGFADKVLPLIGKASVFLVKPLLDEDPLALLTAGRLVDWTWVASAFAIKVVLYSGALAVLASWLFNRKELGLPD